jgi:arabinose-5-phosphate isomerase
MTSPQAGKSAQDAATATLALARQVLSIEAEAVQSLSSRLDASFVEAHALLLACRGRVVVSGMGKSGHIGHKIASTLASTGTPSFFMHPAEAHHGDLGMITGEDVLLALSNSGETAELTAIFPLLKRRGTKLVAITGNSDSSLARQAHVHLNAAVAKEACPLNLAPTASTTAALALGDALAITLLNARGFSASDFARSHPGGMLGRRLSVQVSDIMHTGERLPKVTLDAMLSTALVEMSRAGLGMTAVVDTENQLIGVFTDGDLRRALQGPLDAQKVKISAVMTRNPVAIDSGKLAAEAAAIMQEKNIFGLLAVDSQNKLAGAFNMHDLLRAGVV